MYEYNSTLRPWTFRQRLGTGDEILGRPDRAAELPRPGSYRSRGARHAPHPHGRRGRIPPSPRPTSTVGRFASRDSCTLSPSRDRTSSTAPRTAPRETVIDRAPPRRRAWFKFTPTRRSCSTAAASSGLGAMAAAASIASTCPPLESRASSTVARTHAEGAVPRRSARDGIAAALRGREPDVEPRGTIRRGRRISRSTTLDMVTGSSRAIVRHSAGARVVNRRWPWSLGRLRSLRARGCDARRRGSRRRS